MGKIIVFLLIKELHGVDCQVYSLDCVSVQDFSVSLMKRTNFLAFDIYKSLMMLLLSGTL